LGEGNSGFVNLFFFVGFGGVGPGLVLGFVLNKHHQFFFF